MILATLLFALAAQTAAPRTIALPAGDVRGFDVNYSANTGRTKYTAAGPITFDGEGVDVTHVRAVGEQCVLVDQFAASVTIKDATIHCGTRQGIWFGLAHKDGRTVPEFKLILRNVRIVADTPTVWPVFSYEANLDFQDVTFDTEKSYEHDVYGHGQASAPGSSFSRVTFLGSGAQQIKFRCAPDETDDVRGERVTVTDCTFQNWYRPHTWRGGAAIVLEGASADLVVDRCTFRGGPTVAEPGWPTIPASQRTRAVMVDDGGGAFFDVNTGAVGTGTANGYVIVQNSLFTGGPGAENLSILIRVGNNGAGSHYASRGVLVEGCNLWGERLQLQFSNIPPRKLGVTGCNTPELEAWAQSHGVDTTHEAWIPMPDRLKPVSAGLFR